MRIIKCKNKGEIAVKAFETFNEYMTGVIDPVIGLATGSSPLGLYEEMIKEYKLGNFNLEGYKTFNLDEYIGLEENHSQSYHTFMNENLFDHIDTSNTEINIPNGNAQDMKSECSRYEDLLDKYRIDVQILGIGSNGHIAFNEPGIPLNKGVHIVDLDETTIKDNARFFADIESVPKKAITMGPKNILHAKKIILIASGKNKASAIGKMVNGDVTDSLPASILQLHRHVTIILDEDASSEL